MLEKFTHHTPRECKEQGQCFLWTTMETTNWGVVLCGFFFFPSANVML